VSHDDCLLEEWLFPNKNVLTSIKRAVLSVTRDQRGMRHICKALRALFQSKKCAFASINDSELEHTRKKQRKSSGIKKKCTTALHPPPHPRWWALLHRIQIKDRSSVEYVQIGRDQVPACQATEAQKRKWILKGSHLLLQRQRQVPVVEGGSGGGHFGLGGGESGRMSKANERGCGCKGTLAQGRS